MNEPNESAPEKSAPPRFEAARRKARKVMEQQEKLGRLLNEANEKAHHHRKRLAKFLAEIRLLIRLVRAYASGEYRKIPWRAILTAVAAIIYFVNPFDLIPDFLAWIGFLDDAAVIGFVINSLRKELQEFQAFLDGQPAPQRDDEVSPARTETEVGEADEGMLPTGGNDF